MARDAGIDALVEYYDRHIPDRFGFKPEEWVQLPQAQQIAMLTPQERQAIFEQVQLCKSSFEYAARNYFWLVNNESKDQLFSLWESQYLVLETMRRIKERGKAQKIFVIKARRLGCSTLIEALIAWRAIFFRNVYGIVISVDEDDAAYLFGFMQHFYDKLPWWMKPEISSREIKGGLIFDRKDPSLRAVNPGNNSEVKVQYSTQFSGVGQGRRVSAAHISEMSDYEQKRAEEIVMEDLTPAIHPTPENFAFIETTGKGTGNMTHRLWRASEKLAERAEWYPLFLASFFEHSRTIFVPDEWKPQRPELAIRERVRKEWVKCNHCNQFQHAIEDRVKMLDATCPMCLKGKMLEVILTPGQLGWMEERRIQAEANGREAVKKYRQEFSISAEESFQVSGYSVFDDQCYEKVTETIEDPEHNAYVKVGLIGNPDGKFHGYNPDTKKCYAEGCTDDHRMLSPMDALFTIYRDPVPGAEYSIGCDVSEGIGEDYSVIFVNRIGGQHAPDEEVAVWRDNWTDPKAVSFFCNAIGRMYNDALMAIEYNLYNIVGDDVLYKYQYPNIYIWKNKENRHGVLTHKYHWWTKAGSKTLLYQTARSWLRSGAWIIHSKLFRDEMTTFVKEGFEERNAKHAQDQHDDLLMAAMISLYCPHELDTQEGTGRIPVPQIEDNNAPKDWLMRCGACGGEWEAERPDVFYSCPLPDEVNGGVCGSIQITGKRKIEQRNEVRIDFPPGSVEEAGSNAELSWNQL